MFVCVFVVYVKMCELDILAESTTTVLRSVETESRECTYTRWELGIITESGCYLFRFLYTMPPMVRVPIIVHIIIQGVINHTRAKRNPHV